MPTLGVTCAFTLGFAHYPWRDRNRLTLAGPWISPSSLITPGGIATGSVRPVHQRGGLLVRSLPLEGSQLECGEDLGKVGHVRSLPLEGSQRLSRGDAVLGGEVRSLPLEGSQLSGSACSGLRPSRSLITPGGIATWSRAFVLLSGAGSLITPGGIATLNTKPLCRGEHRVRSLPLEGSQHPRRVRRVGFFRRFAHYPWRDRNRDLGNRRQPPGPVRSLPLEGSQREVGGQRLNLSPGSLITPGGIATRRACRPKWRRPPFAHYPWRDRNNRSPSTTSTPPLVRSLPLEGSQPHGHRYEMVALWFAHYPWRDRNVTRILRARWSPSVRSLPLEGSQHRPAPIPLIREVVRSLPLEGSQRRPPRPLGRCDAGSLITPGGIATMRRRG